MGEEVNLVSNLIDDFLGFFNRAGDSLKLDVLVVRVLSWEGLN